MKRRQSNGMRLDLCFLGMGLICAVLVTLPAHAQDSDAKYKGWELRSGFLAHDRGPFTNNLSGGEGEFDINGQLLFPSPKPFKHIGAPRPHLGVSIAVDGTSQVFTGLTWDVYLSKEKKILRNIYLTLEGGGAVHNGEDLTPSTPPSGGPGDTDIQRFLGCRAVFRFAYGIGYDINERVSAQIYTDRLTTLGICDFDQGLENTGIRLGYKF